MSLLNHFLVFLSKKSVQISPVLSFLFIIMISLLFSNNISFAQMPPDPSLMDKIKNGEIQKPYNLINLDLIRNKGVDEAWSSPRVQIQKQNPYSKVYGMQSVPNGSFKVLVILVQFSDKAAKSNSNYFDNLVFGQAGGTVRDYYNKISYGNLDLVTINLPSSLGWVTAPQTYSYYDNGKNGEGSYPQNSQKLVEDIINIVDQNIDFSKYDNDGDGYVDDLIIVHSGSGAEHTGSNNDIWSHSWVTHTLTVADGVKIYHYSIVPEYWNQANDMTCGVFAHEMGHSVFGLPDLYDTDHSSAGLGNWSLMAGGSWNGTLGNSPAFPDGWTHTQMGYLTPTIVSSNISGQSINNVENIPEAYILQNSISGNEYFLVENRQKIGYDTYLPGNGLCIYHVDNSVSNNNNEWFPGHTSSGHYKVALIQADGLWSLEHNSLGNTGDTYPGSNNNRDFSSLSIPDSWNYNLVETGIGVSNISTSSSTMTADFKIDTKVQLPQFSVQLNEPFPAVNGCSVAWGDYNNDGYLDVLLTGVNSSSSGDWSMYSKIYRNNGNNTFTEQTSISLPPTRNGSASWGDYDNDGYLDILLTGYDENSNPISKIFHNNGNNTFTEESSISLPGIVGSATWGDFDNDGHLDILLCGEQGSGVSITKIYHNNGNNTFSEQTSVSLPVAGSASSGDYDNDGYLDILLIGYDINNHPISKIYHNNGNNTFSEQTSISLTAVTSGSAAWGDYDNDGYLDIIIVGDDLSGHHHAAIYHNNGNNSFTEQTSIALTGTRNSTSTWGDYDNDGYLDLLITGFVSLQEGSISKIYHNNRDNTFTEQSSIHLFDQDGGATAWGDFNNDGDLDLLACGLWYNDALSLIYQNNNVSKNTIPTFPSNLKTTIIGNDVTFSWNKSVDNETPQSGLTYNLVIGTSPGACNVLSPMADRNTGKRRIVNIGNGGHCNSRTIKNFPDGIYYWSVQAIDNNFAGSEFASEHSFIIGETTEFVEQTSIALTEVFGGSASWGDFNNDGNLDILLTGQHDDELDASDIYRNNGDNTFNYQTSLTDASVSSAAWGDYDNDGFLDILLTGYDYHHRTTFSKIYRNNGNNTFTEQTSIILPAVRNSSVVWGDYNNDGHLDFLLTGDSGGTPISKIFRNNGDNTFTEQTSIYLAGVISGSVAWGDYDKDGYLDILLTGSASSGPVSKIYHNNGDNTFTEQTSISLPGVSNSSVAWGDYDSDGYLDILLTGLTSSGPISKLYHNNGNKTFSEQTSISLMNVSHSAVSWGDYDNDGSLDILLTGSLDGGSNITKIYHNNGNNTFTDAAFSDLTNVSSSAVAWGDYNNDGNLDILLTGWIPVEHPEAEPWGVSKIFQNISNESNTLPSIPSNLKAVANGNVVTFSWDKTTDKETPQNGLTYNLVIGTSPGACNVLSPMSNRNTGKRRIVSIGNAGHCNSKTIKNLANGTYYWSVQAIDNSFAGSAFAPEQVVAVPLAVEMTSLTGSFEKGNVSLNWTTATEINNYGFEVERKRVSSGAKESNWTKIGFVSGNGNCNSPKSYSYLDTKPIGGNVFAYRLKQVDSDGKFTYSDSLIVQILSNSFDLSQNYPNPFNPVTKIRYIVPTIDSESNNLSSDVSVNLEVYDVLGKLQATLVNERKFPGIYEVEFNGANLANGIYFYKYTSGNYTSIKKMILLK